MLSMARRNTNKLIREKSKSENIRIGRFFTKKDTARLMADMFDIDSRETVSVLDPGAGTGILSAALIEALCRAGHAKEIHLVCYENNAMYIPMLEDNLLRIRKRCRRQYKVRLVSSVLHENFILTYRDDYAIAMSDVARERFDYIIANPPSDLLEQDAPEVLAMSDICTGTMDLGSLFFAMSAHLLACGGQMAVLVPTVFATAVHFAKVRSSVLSNTVLRSIHVFSGTDGKKPIKKNMVLYLERKAATPEDKVCLSVSDDDGTEAHTSSLDPMDYDNVVRGEDKTLLILGSENDIKILEYMRTLPATFGSYGLKMKTGLTLVSRYRDCLYDHPVPGSVPLIYPRSVSEGRVLFPVPIRGQYIVPKIPSLVQKNRNMLLVKRVPAKSDPRRLMCGVYMASQTPGQPYISTHNKLNYIDTEQPGEMDAPFLYGLYAFLSSTLCDTYIRIISKSSQINARELSDLPLPSAEILRRLGQRLIPIRVYTPSYCDKVISEILRVTFR